VATQTHGVITAKVFISKRNRRITNGIPSHRYLSLLVEGSREWQFEPAYTRWLESMPSIPKRVCRAFQDGHCQQGPACTFEHRLVIQPAQHHLVTALLNGGFRYRKQTCRATGEPMAVAPSMQSTSTKGGSVNNLQHQIAPVPPHPLQGVTSRETGASISTAPPNQVVHTPKKSKPAGKGKGRRRTPVLEHLHS
jgi:hypothetical protein